MARTLLWPQRCGNGPRRWSRSSPSPEP
jgi:hypothetical protein